MKILYVEDEIAHVELTQRTLEDNLQGNFVLLHAESLRDALKILETDAEIDLVLSDLRLPDGSGLDLLKRVRELPSPPAVVLVTGQGDEQIAVTALKAGAADYLVKQSDYLHRLPVVLSNAVAQNRLAREQAALREAEVKYQALVEQMPAVVFLDAADEAETTIYISPRIEELTGYTSDEWRADPGIWISNIHSEDRERIAEADSKTHLTNEDFQDEYRFVRRDGRVIWIKENTNLIRDKNGNPLYWQGILFDITKERESQQTILASEERFRRIFHSTPIATCVVTVDEGRFIDANQAFQSLVGVSLENLVGRTAVELGFWQSKDDRDNFIIKLKEQGTLKGLEIHFPNVPDGPKDTLGFYELIELGGATCLLAMFYEVTEQKKTQKALQSERDFALQILNNMGQGLTIIDKSGRFEYVNPAYASMIGHELKEILDKTPSNFTAPDSQSPLVEERARRKKGVASTYESKLVHKDGREVPVVITGVPRHQNGEINGAIAVVTDLTVQKQTEQALERQVKELTVLHAVATAEAESRTEDEIIENVTLAISKIYSEVCGILVLDATGRFLTPHPSCVGANISNWQRSYPITEGITGRSVSTGEIIRTGNIKDEPGYIEIASGVISELCIPIRVHARVIGVINVESKFADSFTEHDEGFLTTVASGLGTALEKLRLFESEKRRRQEAETLRQAASAISSTLELDAVVTEILAVLKQVIPYDSGSVFFHEGNQLRIAMAKGFPNSEQLKDMTFSADDELFQIIKSTGRPLIIEDVTKDARFKSWGISTSIRGWMAVPLVTRGHVIGYITLDSHVPNVYNESIGETAMAFAYQAAAATDNARLYDETQRRLQELEIINRVSTSLRLAQSLDEILPILLDETLHLINTPHGSIWLFDPHNNLLTQKIAKGADAKIEHTSLKPGDGIVGHVFLSGEKYIAPDLFNDPLLFTKNRESATSGLSGICIPVLSTVGPMGVLMVEIDKERQLTGEINLLTILAEITGNAIHRAELFAQSQEQIRRLTTLRDIDSAIASSTDLRVTLNILMDHTLKHLKIDAVDVMLYHPELQSLTYLCSAGFDNPSPSRPLMRLGEGLAGQVVMKGGIEHVTDLRVSNEVKRDPMLIREGFVTYFGIPLIVKGQTKGVFEIFHRLPFTPSTDWMHFLQTLAGQAAIAIDNAQLFDHLQRSNQEVTQAYDTTLEGWARALELRDRETEGHTRRVTDLTMQLARYMGISDDELVNIYRGVLLHDIGKMGVPDQILRKTGPLIEAEWVEMRKHPEYAFNLLAPIPYLRPALDIPYSHHEHWDGSGYPRGLKGEQIPLSARVFSIVDIWDALLSDRSYRKAWPEDKVIDYLKEISGTILDPKVVTEFFRMMSIPR